MESWVYWAIFFAAGLGALFTAKFLDDRERHRWTAERTSSAPPTRPPRKDGRKA